MCVCVCVKPLTSQVECRRLTATFISPNTIAKKELKLLSFLQLRNTGGQKVEGDKREGNMKDYQQPLHSLSLTGWQS